MNLKGSQTEKNLLQTFAGESRARNKYTFYAEMAVQEGYEYIAQIFKVTADNEMAHARRVYRDFLRSVKSTAENLMEAATGEAYENEILYKQFQKVASDEGFPEIAEFYKEAVEVEGHHRDRYMRIYNDLKTGRMFKKDRPIKWLCMNCGDIVEGTEAPDFCPLCHYPKAYFMVFDENY